MQISRVDGSIQDANLHTEGRAAHILAHGLLSGAVAQLGGNNPLGAAIAGMTAELTAPLLADYLYGKPVNELSAEEKSTISILTSVAGMASGSVVDNRISNSIQSYQSAQNAVENNWGMVGHYSTMATVLYLAGFSPKDAKAIALAAWAPDTDSRNAITVHNITNGSDSSQPQIQYHLLDGETDPSKVIATQQDLAKQVGQVLSIIKQFENDPATKALYLSQPVVQQVLHSFGDSFAHVQADGTHYDPQWGHVEDGTTPDTPNTHSDAYRNYVSTLFSIASQLTIAPRVGSDTISILVGKVTASYTEEGQKRILGNAISNVSKVKATDLVQSPVKDCEWTKNCQNLDVGSQVNSLINQIYSNSGSSRK